MVKEAKNNVIISQEGSYKDLMSNLPPKQKIVLQAIAKERLAKNITSAKFIKKVDPEQAKELNIGIAQHYAMYAQWYRDSTPMPEQE